MIRYLKSPVGIVHGGEEAPDGDFNILVGVNASGKSCVLRCLKMDHQREADERHELQSDDFVSPNRFIVRSAPQSMSGTAKELAIGQMKNRSVNTDEIQEIEGIDIYDNVRFFARQQKAFLCKWIKSVGLGDLRFEEDSERPGAPVPIFIDDVPLEKQSTGIRGTLSLLVGLLNPFCKVLLIDEPELSVEPRLQKQLFELIRKVAFGELVEEGIIRKKVYLATHSHLFLDREDFRNNWVVEKIEETGRKRVRLSQLEDQVTLEKVCFDLLGGSPSDLFFPSNVVVVEGPTDARFLEKVMELRYPGNFVARGVKFHYAGGDSQLLPAAASIVQMLKTAAYIPVYRKRLCVIGDKSLNASDVLEIKKLLKGDDVRVKKLGKNGIEYYYPLSILMRLTGLPEDGLDGKVELFLKQINAQHDKVRSTGELGKFKGTKGDLCLAVVFEMTETSELSPEILNTLERAYEETFRD